MDHRYTQAPLPVGHPTFVARTPGIPDVVRLFPEPSLAGHGSLGVEGGITFVAGPGMGRTTLLEHVQHALETERHIPCARVGVSADAREGLAGGGPEGFPGGFYGFCGALAERARVEMSSSPSLAAEAHAPLRAALAVPPEGDVPGQMGALTPRGLQAWIATVGRAAAQGRGCCLLFDDLDAVGGTEWSAALVAGLRFTFQSASGVTPIFAVWDLYFEESLPGSNYFRNVTRPIFVQALGGGSDEERERLVDVDCRALGEPTRAAIFRRAGGHPALLQRALGDLASTCTASDLEGLAPERLDAVLAKNEAERRRAVLAVLKRVPQLLPALRKLEGPEPVAFSALPEALLTSGLVDRGASGRTVLPTWIRDGLADLARG